MDSDSDWTPQSFTDDLVDIHLRMPGLDVGNNDKRVDIPQWLDSVNDSSSTVVGKCMSFFDDGADLLEKDGAGPGFGVVDEKYYGDGKRKEMNDDEGQEKGKRKDGVNDAKRRESHGKYHPDAMRAINADIQNTLRSMRQVTNMRIVDQYGKVLDIDKKDRRDQEWKGKDAKERRKVDEKDGPPPGYVRVFIPPEPPHFVIHGEDGRIIFVDGDEEPIDSKPREGLLMRREDRDLELAQRYQKPTNKQRDDGKGSHGNDKQQLEHKSASRSCSTRSRQPSPSAPNPYISGGLDFPCTAQSKDPRRNRVNEETKPNYHAPTIEDAAETRAKEGAEYLNGYDEPYEAYCNSNWGGVPVRVGKKRNMW